MALKITNRDCRYSIIDSRTSALAAEYAAIIKVQSSTELQPWIAVNFTADGKAIGGCTMQDGARASLIEKAGRVGMLVEEV